MASSLSSEHMAQLAPLLGSLARLLAQHGTLAAEHVQVLLVATDLDTHPAALAEIQRWARLLARVRGTADSALRQTVVESLLLRGLPEATVLLAVATVVGNVPAPVQATAPPAAPVPLRLQASVTALDFGTLPFGQGATGELEVQGGPGHVRVESDYVEVTPRQFGVEPTCLRVAIKPLASGLLWTPLKLVTASETLDVPVVAQWQNAPTVLPQSAPQVVYTSARSPQPTALPPWLPTLIHIPAGPFLMGSTDADKQVSSDEKRQHTLTMPDFWIGKTPVTNAQFRPFVEDDGYRNQVYWTAVGWQWREQNKIVKPGYWDDKQRNGADYPVVGVSWFEAVAYCRWLSAQVGHEFRLPSEAEWEKAARGSDGRIWPWGNTWESGRCNSEEAGLKRTTPVGRYPTGVSPYGVLDMAGNVWEWVATKYGKGYPYQLEDEWAEAYLEVDTTRVCRGGSWVYAQKYVRGAYRNGYDYAHNRSSIQGLRIASHSLMPGSDS